ncbi:MAG TPA: SDR family NAD(P)-dependent oxidoreductase [Gemmataceae bacterium]|nr:SDR family NAD(P)-dependent oxidoreductase [Gemmataceae bacterium]
MGVLDTFRLDGRRALITGASRGLGRAMAQALAEAGADLVIVGRDAESLRQAQQELAALGRSVDAVPADLTTPDAVERFCSIALTNHGPLDILVNNVGGRRENVPLLEQSSQDWQRLMDLNLTSAVLCTKHIGGAMLPRRWGRVINIGSICGQIATRNIHGRHYETAKAALAGFTRAVAADWAPHGVTVNAIAPGGFMTDANRRWFRERPALRQEIETIIPMGRLGEPAELGPLAVYLASEASSYMTGALLVIDGGYTLW